MPKMYFQWMSCFIMALALAACGGGGGGGGEEPSETPALTDPDPALTDPDPALTDPDPALTDPGYVALSDRDTIGLGNMAYVLLNRQGPTGSDAVSLTYSSGAIAGGLLDGTNIDGAEYINPANGDYSRVVWINGESIFGAVGLDVQAGDLPTTDTATYNEGWVGMVTVVENGTYVLEGDAQFTANWAEGHVDGEFSNLAGTFNGTDVGDQGTITLTEADIVGDNFIDGSVTGTGIFAPLDESSSTSGTNGTFFGPAADELGGVLSIDDSDADIRVLGAFQAD